MCRWPTESNKMTENANLQTGDIVLLRYESPSIEMEARMSDRVASQQGWLSTRSNS